MSENITIIQMILEIIKGNKNLLDPSLLKEYAKQVEDKWNELYYLGILQENHADILEQVIWVAIQHKVFNKKEFNDVEKQLQELIDNDSIEETIIEEVINNKEEVVIEDIVKEEIIEDIKQEVKKDVLTANEINKLIAKWVNLYKAIPWDKIPRDDNLFYSQIQLYRFIDSGWSDFVIETQKIDWKIYSMIKFKISWEHETQDKTDLARPTDKSKGNMNKFFDSVRKYIWGTLGDMNTDLKHVMQDSSFSLEFRENIRSFRMNSMPTRCYNQVFPRYVLRLTSDWDAIDFDSIELLPFMKDMYSKMINGKSAWVIAVTWPTGSWKTTTIYGMLNKIDKEKYWVLSIEKPIESQVHGVNQTQEDSSEREDKKQKYTNKEWMKGVLRQALDVIFIWEMRDSEETIEWIKAWLIWNKLITTFHTNSCVDTILRLKEEWVTNNAIWNWVKYITWQRLVAKLCPSCSVQDPEMDKVLKKIDKLFRRSRLFFQIQFKKLLEHIPVEEINNLELLEMHITKDLVFLSEEDIEVMIEMIEDRVDDFSLIKTKPKKIEFLLDLYSEFPSPELRRWINSRISEANIKIHNPKWCNYEWEEVYCKNWYLTWGKSRIMIAEVMKIDKPIKRYIQDPDSKLIDLESFLMDKWFITMKMYWYLLALDGLTTIERVNEVVE